MKSKNFEDLKLYLDAKNEEEKRMKRVGKILVRDGASFKLFLLTTIICLLGIFGLSQIPNLFVIIPIIILSICIITCFTMGFSYYQYRRVEDGILIKSYFRSKLFLFSEIKTIELDYSIKDAKSYSSQTYLKQGNATFKMGGKRYFSMGDLIMEPKITLKNGEIHTWKKKQGFHVSESKNFHERIQEKEKLIKKEIFKQIAKWKFVFKFPEGYEDN